MPLNKVKRYVLFSLEILFPLLLFVGSIIVAQYCLKEWHGPGGSISTDLYIPSVMFACGKGLVNVNPTEVPHLRSFLDFNEQVFLPEYIPHDLKIQELDQYEQYHRYLVFTVGLIWRLLGVSWEVLKWFLIVLYAITVLIVYGMARVFMPSYFAFFVGYSFLDAQAPLIILPILRDFARAPFIFAILLILFLLSYRRLTQRRYILYCLLLGLVAGIGIGFRRDLLMFVLLSLIVLAIFPSQNRIPKISVRLVGIAIVVIVFLLSSYPILQSFQRFGTLGWHDILMGCGTEHDDMAGLERTNYERVPKYNDLLVSASADAYCYFNKPLKDYEYSIKRDPELEKRELFFAYLYWFPADMLIRTYSAIARILDRILTSALPINPYRTGLSLGIMALFMAIDFRKGLCFNIILLYCMAIQTLQFNFRHNFYLAFIPWLLYSLFFYWLIAGIYHVWREGRKQWEDNWDRLKKIMKRFCIISFTGIFFALGFLIVIRQVQSYQLSRLFRTYQSAELVPVSYKTYSDEEKTIYSLEKPLFLRFEERLSPDCGFALNMLVVDFTINTFSGCFEVLYDGGNDFSHELTLLHHGKLQDSPTHVRYFIPIYENFVDSTFDWNRFVGLRIKDFQNIKVEGMYKICNMEHIPLAINVYFSNNELPQLYQKIAPYSKENINPLWRPYQVPPRQALINDTRSAFFSGETQKAYSILQEAMERESCNMEYGFVLANFYEESGHIEEAKQTLIKLLINRPHDPLIGINLNSLILRTIQSQQERQNFWEQIANQLSDSSIVWYYYAKNSTDPDVSKKALSKAISLNNEITIATSITSSYYSLNEIFSKSMKKEQNGEESLCSSIPLRTQISYMLTSGMYLNKIDNYQKALEILQLLQKIVPDLYLVYPPIIYSIIHLPEPDIYTVLYYAKTIAILNPYKLEPITQLEDIYNNIPPDLDVKWVEIWQELEKNCPDSPCILCGLGRAYELEKQNQEAEQAYKKAIKYARKSESCAPLAYYRLALLYNQINRKDDAIYILKKGIKKYPDNGALVKYLEQLQQ